MSEFIKWRPLMPEYMETPSQAIVRQQLDTLGRKLVESMNEVIRLREKEIELMKRHAEVDDE